MVEEFPPYVQPYIPKKEKSILIAELCLMLREEGMTYQEIMDFTDVRLDYLILAIEQGKLLRIIEEAHRE